MKKLCIVSCPIATRSGYGARSRDFVRSLIKARPDWDVKILPQRWGATPQNALISPIDDDLVSRLVLGQINQKPDVWIQITIPNEFQPMGNYNIGITAGIETNQASPQFIEGCNRMNLTLVSSNHAKSGLEVKYDMQDEKTQQKVGELGLTKPVEVLFEGFDEQIYDNKLPVEQSVKDVLSDVSEEFCFLFVGHWLPGECGQDRKNVCAMIYTFLQSFKGKKTPPALVLKTNLMAPSYVDTHEIKKRIESLKEQVRKESGESKLPNIYLLSGDLSDIEMNSLYNHTKVKAHVSFTKGEGFGRPLLEAMISGKPIIAPKWSGHMDFLDNGFNVLVSGELEEIHQSAVNDWLIKGSKWFKINISEAAGYMKDIYENYNKYLELSRKNRKYAKDNFTFDKMTQKLSEYLEKYGADSAPQMVGLKLPTLKKIELPKLKKLGETNELSKIKLPELKKVDVNG